MSTAPISFYVTGGMLRQAGEPRRYPAPPRRATLMASCPQVVPMRPLDYARLQTIGDCLQICSRLLTVAQRNQIVISNILRQALQRSGYEFAAMPPFEARHIGVLQ